MVKINLRELINREENLAVINELISLMDISILIEDEEGIILQLGTIEDCSEKYEISTYGEVISFIRGDKRAKSFVKLISLLVNNEVDKKKMANEALQGCKEVGILHDLSEKIVTTIGVKDVTKLVIHEVMQHIDAGDGFIFLLNKDTDELTLEAELYNRLGMELTMNLNKKVERVDIDFVKSVIDNKTGVVVNDTHSDFRINNEKCVLSSLICVPLIVKAKAIGAIVIGSETPSKYKTSDLNLCSTIAVQAGATIENARLYDVLKETFFETVQTLSEIIEMRADPTKGHTRRVINYSLNLAKALKLSGVEIVKVKLGAMLHDIGNIGISDELLRKKDFLTNEEVEIIRNHPILGAEIVKKIDQLKDIAPIIRAHHERYDGTGYPDGLKGEEIPLIARIISVADVFDEITNENGENQSLYFASEALKNSRGTQFDAEIVDMFFEIYKDKTLEEIQSFVLRDSM